MTNYGSHWIAKAVYEGEYQIFFEFNNGIAGHVDLEDKLDSVIFEPLEDIDYLKKFDLIAGLLYGQMGLTLLPKFSITCLLRSKQSKR